MSGILVGEVIAAAAWLKDKGLTERGFHALVAIADRCMTDSRQGSVSWAHIRAGLFGASASTAKRAVSDCKSVGVLRVVKRGFDNHAGRACAPIYELEPLGEQVTQVNHSPTSQRVTQVTHSPTEPTGQTGERTGQNRERTGHPGDLLNGSTNGSKNGARARNGRAHADAPTAAERTEAAEDRRHAIANCGDCDELGWELGADGTPVDPPVDHHPNRLNLIRTSR